MKKLLVCLIFLIYCECFAQSTIILDNQKNEVEVGKNCFVFKDSEGKFNEKTIEKIPFEAIKTNRPSFYYTDATAWIKINIQNNSTKHWLLELDNPSINEVDFILTQNNHPISYFSGGDTRPFSNYQIEDRNPIFDLKLAENQSFTIYIRGKSTEDLSFPLTFYDSNTLYGKLAKRNLFWGIYFGFVLLIALYNFFLWLTIRDKTYLYYVLYVLTFGLFQFSLYGFGFQYIWGNSFFNEKAHAIFVGASVTFLTLFSIHFLNLFKEIPNSKIFFQILGIVWIIIYAILVLTFSHLSVIILMMMSVIGLFFQYYYSIKLFLKGNRSVRFYLLANVAMTIAILIILLKSFFKIPGDFYLKIGSMIEMVLFSLALGDKYRFIEMDRIRQQRIRDEISANLHDDLAASLSSLTMYSESNRRKAQKNSPDNEAVFKKISDKSREILNQVRESVWEMTPRNDNSDEWLDRMIRFATETLEAKQIDLNLEIDPKIQTQLIPIDKRHDLYLFFKECINNIAKHSEANLVKIQFHLTPPLHFGRGGKGVRLSIKDNGKGFIINDLQKGNGLLNLKKRAINLNGKYNIESVIGEGTEVSLWF
jgi:signal transduction histidine kinase